MAQTDFESSVDRGQPVELYKFTYGSDASAYYAYTDGETPVAYDDGTGEITYQPLAGLTRTNIKVVGGPRSKGNEIPIEVPLDSDVAELFRVYPPSYVVSVIIRSGHIPNPDDPASFAVGDQFPVVWVGRVLDSVRGNGTAKLTCEAAAAGMRRVGLRQHYQWACPLALYGSRCGADKEVAKVVETLDYATSNTVRFEVGWSGEADTTVFIGGLLEWDTPSGVEVRTIYRFSNNRTAVLSGPVGDLDGGDSVRVYLGCPHTLDGCTTLHDNAVNYGGQPFIPTYNPVGKNNHT